MKQMISLSRKAYSVKFVLPIKLTMRKIFTLLAFLSINIFGSQAQTVLFSENFNNGNSGFNINTPSVGGSFGNTNYWAVNSAYAGGSFIFDCAGFPFPINLADTPDQPAAIVGSPQSNYMHITSLAGQGNGVENCHFIAGNQLCVPDEINFAEMNTSISTVGQTGVTLDFWYICAGFSGSSFGEIYFSTNDGSSWTLVNSAPVEYVNTPNWTQALVTNPAFDNQPNLRIGFKFETIASFDAAVDPAFGIDDIQIYSSPQGQASVNLDPVNSGPYCPGSTFTLPYTATGTFNPGNAFNVVMSNASGSFATPTVIGTAVSGTSGSINVTIPAGTTPGTGYLFNIVATSPATLGTPVGPVTINSGPIAVIDAESSNSVCSGGSAVLLYSGTPGDITWLISTNGLTFTPILGETTNILTSEPLTVTTYFQASVSTECGAATSASWTVNIASSVNIPLQTSPNSLNLCNGPITISTVGTYTDLIWSNGQTGLSAIVVSEPGAISVTGQDLSGCPGASSVLNLIETIPPALTVTPGNPILFCGSPINLTAVGGFASYAWSTGQTGPNLVVTALPIGALSVSAVDNNGCNVGPVQIDVQPAGNVEVPVSPSLAAICDGEPATLSAAPGFNNYQWSNGALGQNILVSFSGFYSVTVTDANGCTGTSAQVEVMQSQSPIANFSYTQNNGGYTINFNNSSQNGISYEWLFDTLSTSPLEEPTFTFPENGPYYITLIIENPCGIDTITKLVIVAQVGMEDILSMYEAQVFPNPSSSNFNLMLNSAQQENFDLILTDIQGRLMYHNTVNFHGNHAVNIPTDNMSNGLYLLHLRTKNGTGTLKLIKN
jgi:hypothetical protein